MRFSSIRLVPVAGASITLPFNDSVAASKFTLIDVDGLGPPDITLNLVDMVADGRVYQGRRSSARRVVMRVGFKPDYSIGENSGDVREQLYRLLDNRGGLPVTLQLRSQNDATVIVQSTGFVAKIEANPFSKDPEAIVTFDCLRPFLEAPSLTASYPVNLSGLSIENYGNADTGFFLDFVYDPPSSTNATNFRLTRTGTGGYSFQVNWQILPGDIIRLDSNAGLKSILLIRGAVTTNIMAGVTATSIWPVLYPGVNPFTVSGTAATWTSTVRIWYTQKYWGV